MACTARPKSPITLMVSANKYSPFLSLKSGMVCTKGLELIRVPFDNGTNAIFCIIGFTLSLVRNPLLRGSSAASVSSRTSKCRFGPNA